MTSSSSRLASLGGTAAALLTTALPLVVNGEAQLLPAGEFAARDGRPGKNLKWKVSDASGARLAGVLNATAAQTPIVIDYEHQTMLSQDNGKKAPAAGWIVSVDWRPAKGLFAQVDWTKAAQQHIEAKEYRFISPVIDFDKATGEITGLHNAALTNFPALTGMEPVAARLNVKGGPDRATLRSGAPETPSVEVERLVARGIREFKLTEEMRGWAEKLGATELEALRSFLGATPVGRHLNDEQRAVMRAFGVDAAEFASGQAVREAPER